MAKRESQGMQIAMILTVMFAVLFLITTVVFWNISRNLRAEVEQANAKANDAQSSLRATISENQSLKRMLGHPENEELQKVEKQYADDMTKFGPSFPQEEQNYRKLPEYLSLAVQQLHGKLTAANSRISELESSNQQLQKDVESQAAAAAKALDDAKNEYLAERTTLQSELQKMKDVQADAQQKHESERREVLASNNKIQADMREMQKQVAYLTSLNERNGAELAQLKNESFEIPDGKIIWVDKAGTLVQVNLGSADGLQRQTTFSVFDVDENNLARTEKKGSIEITDILEPHLAQGRILQEDLRNPIAADDVIYSPTWQVGSAVRFALTGFMDIDQDGESDRALIRRLITLNGGVVDAEVDDDGNSSGKISVQTRFLVVGDEISEKSSAKLQRADTQLRTDAKSLGVTVIPMDRLLSDLGYQRISKSVALGQLSTDQDYRRTKYDPDPAIP